MPVNSTPTEGTAVTIGIRPEHFADAGAGDADLKVAVDVAEHLGHTSYIYASVTDEALIIERPETRHSSHQSELTVGLPARRCFLFNADGQRLR
ncbi:TOBE domain-containing protein [Aliirhizobium terrae]|uniref:TOBE domain-containing protein n=1 Tax=Terrirhizobium terrae TaxID=2926709 RepID=UPI00336ADC22